MAPLRLSVFFPATAVFMLVSNLLVLQSNNVNEVSLLLEDFTEIYKPKQLPATGKPQSLRANGSHLITEEEIEKLSQNESQVLSSSRGSPKEQQNQEHKKSSLFNTLLPSRFPEYGTKEFQRKCSWVPDRSKNHVFRNCTLLAKLNAKSGEGISDLMNRVAETHQIAIQGNCHLLIEYGLKGVDLRNVFAARHENWTVPDNYDCTRDPTCFQAKGTLGIRWQLEKISKAAGIEIQPVPYYRAGISKLQPEKFSELRQRLPGFDVFTGMACSFTSLLKLAPTASSFEPKLFTELLPQMHQSDALVLALYIRTGLTDKRAWDEQGKPHKVSGDLRRHEQQAKRVISCAEQVEKEHLFGKTSTYRKAVWMLVTDSPHLKDFVRKEYSKPSRTILTTSSRGIHTRPSRQPSMRDVAEALIDWYLIGESTTVIQDGSVTFGQTASLRTARPLRMKTNVGYCQQVGT